MLLTGVPGGKLAYVSLKIRLNNLVIIELILGTSILPVTLFDLISE